MPLNLRKFSCMVEGGSNCSLATPSLKYPGAAWRLCEFILVTVMNCTIFKSNGSTNGGVTIGGNLVVQSNFCHELIGNVSMQVEHWFLDQNQVSHPLELGRISVKLSVYCCRT